MNFECKNCTSFCCVVPPAITTEQELEKALSYGVRVVATPYKNLEDAYLVSIVKDKETDMCPFVSKENYKCSIYDDNFMKCTIFNCKAKNYKIKELLVKVPTEVMELLTTTDTPEEIPIALFRKHIVEKHKIEILDVTTALDIVNLTSIDTAKNLLEQIVIKNRLAKLS